LFDENHVVSLAIEGRESPRRRPGRPRKQKPTEISVELMLEDTTAAEDVDPEQALELMFKEAEENRITSVDSNRHRRQRRVPRRLIIFIHKIEFMLLQYIKKLFRFQGVVQGKELDAILRDEGLEEELIEDNEELDKDDETTVEVILVIAIFFTY